MIESSKRLSAVFAMAERASAIGDIGCDHGYISFALLQDGIAEKVVATDISAPSLEKARRLLEAVYPAEKFRIARGDGFMPIAPGEIQAAVIIGMGGQLIAEILERGWEVIKELDYILVQPMQGAEELFRHINAYGYTILDAQLIEERKKYYPILKLRAGGEDRADWGRFRHSPVFCEMAEQNLARLEKIAEAVRNAKPERLKEVEEEIGRWEEYLESIGNRG